MEPMQRVFDKTSDNRVAVRQMQGGLMSRTDVHVPFEVVALQDGVIDSVGRMSKDAPMWWALVGEKHSTRWKFHPKNMRDFDCGRKLYYRAKSNRAWRREMLKEAS